MKSPFRTCEYCLHFYRGRNRVDYCSIHIKIREEDGVEQMIEKVIGDSCHDFQPKNAAILAIIEAAENEYGYGGDDELQDV